MASILTPSTFKIAGFNYDVHERGWDDPSVSELVRYNLHYLDWLSDVPLGPGGRGACDYVHQWQFGNLPGVGTGWHAYPTSLRIVNLLKRQWREPFFDASITASLVVQARWLAEHVEWHILGNHVIANGKALCFAGLFFSGREADQLLQRGVAILERELEEQILEDGGHFERSPMYHAIVLEDVMDLLNLFRSYRRALDGRAERLLRKCREYVPRMIRWLDAMTHPDGGPAFFNDCCLDTAPTVMELRKYATRLGVEPISDVKSDFLLLEPSGYVRLDRGPATLIMDVGPIGPDYIPGHAHADTLSIELSVDGRRVLVNSGTSDYGTGFERQRQRGTAAHNTVSIDGIDSSEVWDGFRVGRRASTFGVSVSLDGEVARVTANHTGYRWRPGRPVHRREVALRDGSLEVFDIVGVRGRGLAHWHLSPAAEVLGQSKGFEVRLDGVRPLRLDLTPASFLQHGRDRWHAGFGRTQINEVLRVQMIDGFATLRLHWDP